LRRRSNLLPVIAKPSVTPEYRSLPLDAARSIASRWGRRSAKRFRAGR
jgi:hypothetical protein